MRATLRNIRGSQMLVFDPQFGSCTGLRAGSKVRVSTRPGWQVVLAPLHPNAKRKRQRRGP